MEMTFRVAVAARKGVSGETATGKGQGSTTESAPSVSGKRTIADTRVCASVPCPRRFPSSSQNFRRRRRLLRRACSPTTLEKPKKKTTGYFWTLNFKLF